MGKGAGGTFFVPASSKYIPSKMDTDIDIIRSESTRTRVHAYQDGHVLELPGWASATIEWSTANTDIPGDTYKNLLYSN